MCQEKLAFNNKKRLFTASNISLDIRKKIVKNIAMKHTVIWK